jgi:hypothetical protein
MGDLKSLPVERRSRLEPLPRSRRNIDDMEQEIIFSLFGVAAPFAGLSAAWRLGVEFIDENGGGPGFRLRGFDEEPRPDCCAFHRASSAMGSTRSSPVTFDRRSSHRADDYVGKPRIPRYGRRMAPSRRVAHIKRRGFAKLMGRSDILALRFY